MVSLAAWNALNDLPTICVFMEIMLRIEYAIFSQITWITLLIMYLATYANYAPNVLSATIQIVGAKIFDYIDDSVLELLDLLDDYHNVNENVIRVVFDVFDALTAVMDRKNIEDKAPFDQRFMFWSIWK